MVVAALAFLGFDITLYRSKRSSYLQEGVFAAMAAVVALFLATTLFLTTSLFTHEEIKALGV